MHYIVCVLVDDVYLHTMLCVRMSRKQKGWLIGMTNKNAVLQRLYALPDDSKHNEISFSMISTDSLCLRVARMPRS